MSIFHYVFSTLLLKNDRFPRGFRPKNATTTCQNIHFPTRFWHLRHCKIPIFLDDFGTQIWKIVFFWKFSHSSKTMVPIGFQDVFFKKLLMEAQFRIQKNRIWIFRWSNHYCDSFSERSPTLLYKHIKQTLLERRLKHYYISICGAVF